MPGRQPLRPSRTRFLLATLCCCAGLLAFAGPAAAIPTSSSQITTPANPAFPVGEGGTEFTVAGTAEHLTEVDIECYYGRSSAFRVILKSKVPVTANHFSTMVTLDEVPHGICQLRAVPPEENGALPPGESFPWEGPLLAPSYYEPEGTTNYSLRSSSDPFTLEFEDVGNYGLESSVFVAPLHETVRLLYGVAALREEPDEALGRSSLQVDGTDAFAPAAAEEVNSTAPGLPSAAVRQAISPITRQAVIVEEDPIVKCSSGSFPHKAENCPSFVSTGVELVREWRTSSEDQLAMQTDTWRSTDGASHTVSARYYTEMKSAKEGGAYEFPGQSVYSATTNGETKPLPAGPGAIRYRWNAGAPEAEDPEAALVYDSPSTPVAVLSGTEKAESNVLELPYERTVTAATPAVLRFAYAQGFSPAQVGSLASAAIAGFSPAVSIASPANGFSTASPAVTVTGTASDTGVLTGLTVNGAAVPVGAGGAWSASVGLKAGANTITAVATDQAGLSSSAAITVDYVPPPPAAVASVRSFKVSGGKVTVAVKCTGAKGTSCKLLATLTTVEKLSHGKLKSLAAKLRSKSVTVGSQKITLAAGKSATITIALNGTGRRLLARFHRLPVKALVQLIPTAGKNKNVSSATLTITPAHRKKKKKHH